MCFGLNGGFGPMKRPMFHGWRVVSLFDGMIGLRLRSCQRRIPNATRPRHSCVPLPDLVLRLGIRPSVRRPIQTRRSLPQLQAPAKLGKPRIRCRFRSLGQRFERMLDPVGPQRRILAEDCLEQVEKRAWVVVRRRSFVGSVPGIQAQCRIPHRNQPRQDGRNDPRHEIAAH